MVSSEWGMASGLENSGGPVIHPIKNIPCYRILTTTV